MYKPWRDPALATDGRERIFVAVSDRPIAEVGLRTREVHYRNVRTSHRHLSSPPPVGPGSGGVQLRFAPSAMWLGAEQLAVGGFDELPGRLRNSRVGHRSPERALQIVDTRTWRHIKAIQATWCFRLQNLTPCNGASDGFPPDGKGSRGPGLVTYDRNWRRLYVKRSPQFFWHVAAGRLLAGSADGRRLSQIDPATGEPIRKIQPATSANDMWPLDLIAWAPR